MFTTIRDAYREFSELHGSEEPAWGEDELRSWLHKNGHTRYEDIDPEVMGEAVDAELAELTHKQAQMIKPYLAPSYLIEPQGEESDADDVEAITDALANGTAGTIASDLLGWEPYKRIVRVDDGFGGSVDYVISW
jgi:hypothetical protein